MKRPKLFASLGGLATLLATHLLLADEIRLKAISAEVRSIKTHREPILDYTNLVYTVNGRTLTNRVRTVIGWTNRTEVIVQRGLRIEAIGVSSNGYYTVESTRDLSSATNWTRDHLFKPASSTYSSATIVDQNTNSHGFYRIVQGGNPYLP